MGGIFERIDGTPAQRRGQTIARFLFVIAAILFFVELYFDFVVHRTGLLSSQLSAVVGLLIVASGILKWRSTPKQAR